MQNQFLIVTCLFYLKKTILSFDQNLSKFVIIYKRTNELGGILSVMIAKTKILRIGPFFIQMLTIFFLTCIQKFREKKKSFNCFLFFIFAYSFAQSTQPRYIYTYFSFSFMWSFFNSIDLTIGKIELELAFV